MKAWIMENILQSVTMWIWIVLFIVSTIALFAGLLNGTTWVPAQGVFAGIALAKRLGTQMVSAKKDGE